MPHIRITGPALALPVERIAPERLLDLVGCVLEADGHAVAVLRQEYPDLPAEIDHTYAVAIADVLEALALKPSAHPDAVLAWGALIEGCLVYFPASSVEFDATREGV